MNVICHAGLWIDCGSDFRSSLQKTGGLPDSFFLSQVAVWSLMQPWLHQRSLHKLTSSSRSAPSQYQRAKSLCLQSSLTPWPLRLDVEPWSCEDLWLRHSEWKAGGRGNTLLMVAEYQDLDMHPTCFLYLFRLGHLIQLNYHTHFSQQRLIQFGSGCYLLEN